jgi:hypothetical protein
MKFTSYQYSFNDDRGEDCSCSGPDSYKSAVGAQLFIMTAPRAPIMALTGYVRQRILKV